MESLASLPIELEHSIMALKHANFDLKTASDHRKLQLNELNELCDQACENSLIYKERTKKLHDSKIKNHIFNTGDRVLLFNSRLKIFSGKLKTRWYGYYKNLKKTVKTGQTWTRERKENTKAERMLSKYVQKKHKRVKSRMHAADLCAHVMIKGQDIREPMIEKNEGEGLIGASNRLRGLEASPRQYKYKQGLTHKISRSSL
ncbi:hypothetical protein Tco_1318593 [Tanacetum coccineum]